MKRILSTVALTASAVLAPLAVAAPQAAPATADVAPGAPIRALNEADFYGVIPPEYQPLLCSQSINGIVTLPDGTQQRVMVTAGHCVRELTESPVSSAFTPRPRPEVYVPVDGELRKIGTVDRATRLLNGVEQLGDELIPALNAALNSPDWAMVLVDDHVTMTSRVSTLDKKGTVVEGPVLTGVRDYPDLEGSEVSFDVLGQPVCYAGQTTGEGCGTQVMRTRNGIWFTPARYEGGDSGGVNYDPRTNEAIGITSMTFPGINRMQPLDIALQEAYGIPDGQVNERFSVTAETPAATAFDSMNDSAAQAAAQRTEHIANTPTPEFYSNLLKAFEVPQPRIDMARSITEAVSPYVPEDTQTAVKQLSVAVASELPPPGSTKFPGLNEALPQVPPQMR